MKKNLSEELFLIKNEEYLEQLILEVYSSSEKNDIFFAQTMNHPGDSSQPSLPNPQSSLANSSLLIKLIALRADNSVLDFMSQTPLWEIISPELSNQHFWYEKTQTLLNFEIKWNEKENWHQVYNILSSENNPFSIGGALDLEVNGYNLFAVEMLIRLGYDPSIENSRSLYIASKFGSPEVVKLLLRDKRIDPSKLGRYILKRAAEKNRLNILLILLEDPRIGRSSIYVVPVYSPLRYDEDKRKFDEYIQKADPITAAQNNALCIAAEVGSVISVEQLLLDSRVNPNVRDRFPLRTAIEWDRTEVVRVLLQDERMLVDPEEDLKLASEDKTDIMRILLEDPRTYNTLRLRIELLEEAINRQQYSIISLLLEDSRVDPLGKRASEELRSIGLNQSLEESRTISNNPEEMRIRKMELDWHTVNRREAAETLIRSKNLDFRDNYIQRYMYVIISLIKKNIRDSMEGCVLVSGGKFAIESYSGREVSLTQLLKSGGEDTSYDRTHYSLLLREIILKRLDLEYYLEWILKQLKNKNTSAKTRRLFSSVAKSLLSERPIHTSEWFTAYRGFMLLAVSEDAEVILNTLEQEEGVTQEGIDFAGALLGAFLGKKKIEG